MPLPIHPVMCELSDLNCFVKDKVRRRLLSPEDAEAVCSRFVDIVVRQAGVVGVDSEPENAAVFSHGLHVMREAILELHPEWRVELDARYRVSQR